MGATDGGMRIGRPLIEVLFEDEERGGEMGKQQRYQEIKLRCEEMVKSVNRIKKSFATATALCDLVGTDATELMLQEVKELFESLSHHCRQYHV